MPIDVLVAGKIGFDVVDHCFQSLAGGLVILHQQSQHGLGLAVKPGDTQSAQQGVLIGEVAVKGAAGHVGLHADLLDAGFLYALALEQLVGRIFYAGADLLLALFAATQWCFSAVSMKNP